MTEYPYESQWGDLACTPGCYILLRQLASRLWVGGTIAVLVLSTVPTAVCRTRRVDPRWAPFAGIALIVAVNVTVQIMTGVATR